MKKVTGILELKPPFILFYYYYILYYVHFVNIVFSLPLFHSPCFYYTLFLKSFGFRVQSLAIIELKRAKAFAILDVDGPKRSGNVRCKR